MTNAKGPAPGSANLFGIYSTLGQTVVADYDIGEPLGNGAMGKVYKAFDRRMNRPVAIKVLPHWARGDPSAKARLRKEALAASALNHPNIITIYTIIEQLGVDLVVMEYVNGQTLARLIPTKGMTVKNALHLAFQIADAVATAHEAGILHHDIKPANIMVTRSGIVKLLDFGLAQAVADEPEEASRQGRQPGTRLFMAPEQLGGQQGDVRSEVFSFGLVLVEMLAGQHTFSGKDDVPAIEATRWSRRRPLPAKVPLELRRIIDRCLERAPYNRFGSMREVSMAIKGCGGQTTWHAVGTGQRKSSALQAPTLAHVRKLTARVRFATPSATRAALAELQWIVKTFDSVRLRDRVITELKKTFLTESETEDYDLTQVRELRKPILDVIGVASEGRLKDYFTAGDLETMDLYELDFGAYRLEGMSVRKCFMACANFESSVLSGVSFADAAIRNVNFRNADLTGTDFSDADWFNALFLTERQLAAVQPGTLVPCPPTVEALHRFLAHRYQFPFTNWSRPVQRQLVDTWNIYLQPDGLKDFVAAQQR